MVGRKTLRICRHGNGSGIPYPTVQQPGHRWKEHHRLVQPQGQQTHLLCAHWDSRPYADHDPDEANWNTPIDGANDGASGVGVLIENARCFHNQPLPEKLGVDIILFDLEDFGPRSDQAEQYFDDRRNHWALGSQFWATQHHIRGYQASFGILLDMVGGPNPNFMKEYLLARLCRLAEQQSVAHSARFGLS